MSHDPDRRVIVTGALAATWFGFGDMTGAAMAQGAAAQRELKPTPACGDEPTLRQTEGPFFKPRSPERFDLREPGTKGQPIELAGFVLTRACRPLPGALVD